MRPPVLRGYRKLGMLKKSDNYEDIIFKISKILMEIYWQPMYQLIEKRPEVLETFSGFLLRPWRIIFYMSKTHLGIEYLGPERIDELTPTGDVKMEIIDYSKTSRSLLEHIVGMRYEGGVIAIPLMPLTENLILPTNNGIDKLLHLNWNFDAQAGVYAVNAKCPEVVPGKFHRIVNSWFFDSENNDLKVRHIKWLDLIPIEFDDKCDDEVDSFEIDLSLYANPSLISSDLLYAYPVPVEFRAKKLPQINRLIELIGNSSTSERDLTSFLARNENIFMLTMGFGAIDVFHQLLCEWQSEKREAIQPDFFIKNANGYADILEFKLPYLKRKTVVGIGNRGTFSSELNL